MPRRYHAFYRAGIPNLQYPVQRGRFHPGDRLFVAPDLFHLVTEAREKSARESVESHWPRMANHVATTKA